MNEPETQILHPLPASCQHTKYEVLYVRGTNNERSCRCAIGHEELFSRVWANVSPKTQNQKCRRKRKRKRQNDPGGARGGGALPPQIA